MSSTSTVRHYLTTAVANALVVGFAAVGGLLAARFLGADQRGVLAIILLWYGIAQIVAEGGVQGATTYYAARRRVDVHSLMKDTGRLLAAQGTVVAITVSTLVLLLPARVEVRVGLISSLALLPVVLWISSRLFALQAIAIERWNAARLTGSSGYLIAVCALIATGSLTPALTAVATPLTNVLAGLVATTLGRKPLRVSLASSPSDVRITRASIYRFALPNLAWTVPVSLGNRIDQLLVAALLPVNVLGRYAVSATFMALAVPVVQAIGNIVMPRLSHLGSQGQAVLPLARRAFWTAGVGALLTTAALAIAAGFLLPVILGPDYAQVADLAWLLFPATALYAWKWVAADVLRGLGDPRAAAVAEWWGLLLVVVITVPAAIRWGAAGAALGPCAGFGLAVFLMRRAVVSAASQGRWTSAMVAPESR